MNKEFELIVSIVPRGQSDKVVHASREGGARGGTIIYGRGTSVREMDEILGMKLESEKEIVFSLVETSQKAHIMKLINESIHIDEKGEGICFTLPVNTILGTKKMETKITGEKTTLKNRVASRSLKKNTSSKQSDLPKISTTEK